MRRPFILITVALMVLGSALAFADEAVLIDFAKLATDFIPLKDAAGNDIEGKFVQNKATMMDFSEVADRSYTDEQRKQMAISLAIPNWDVVLAPSSRTIDNELYSIVREAKVAEDSKYYPGDTVMGVRVRFPLEAVNSWARVQPPFDVPAFDPKAEISVGDDGKVVIEPTPKEEAQSSDLINVNMTRFEGEYDTETKLTRAMGIVKNVGTIKSVAVNTKGLGFPHGLSIILKDSEGRERAMFMGYLKFDGWRELIWNNPQYVREVRNRELRIDPLYPKASPFVKFAGFIIHRDASNIGGDFIAYFKDVKILYDRAILEPFGDIRDEDVWGIIGQREEERKRMEGIRLGADQVLKYIDRNKQEQRDLFTPSTKGDAAAE